MEAIYLESTIYTLNSNVVLETFDDSALILNLKDATFTELNPTGRDILQATNGVNNLQQVAEMLAGEYEIELEIALKDVVELYQQLLEQGMIRKTKLQKGKVG